MRYTVVWRPSALRTLADIWNRTTDKNAVTVTTNEVDHELIISPETKGQEFFGDQLLVVAPLHVVFIVEPDDRRVTVLHVWSV